MAGVIKLLRINLNRGGVNNPPAGQTERPLTDGSIANYELNASVSVLAGNGNWCDITFGNGKYVAVGSGDRIAYSTDGTSWTAKSLGVNSSCTWRDVVYADGKFVAVGCTTRGYVAYSENGTDWTTKAVGPENAYIWTSITYGNGRFVAIGYNGNTEFVAHSTDGTVWTENVILSDSRNAVLQAVEYGQNKFVAVGRSGQVVTSSDGIDWSPETVGDETEASSWLSIAASVDGKLVMTGNDGRVAVSSDGSEWTITTVLPAADAESDEKVKPSDYVWGAVTYGSSRFVAISRNGYAASSSDGTIWTVEEIADHQSFISEGQYFNCVCIKQ